MSYQPVVAGWGWSISPKWPCHLTSSGRIGFPTKPEIWTKQVISRLSSAQFATEKKRSFEQLPQSQSDQTSWNSIIHQQKPQLGTRGIIWQHVYSLHAANIWSMGRYSSSTVAAQQLFIHHQIITFKISHNTLHTTPWPSYKQCRENCWRSLKTLAVQV